MARTSAMTGGSNSFQTTSEDVNKLRTNMFSDGPIGTLTNSAGVAPATGVWAVNAQGSPNMTVAVSAGDGMITATPTSQNSQRFNVNLAAQNATIPANASGSTVFNWIYVALSATLLANPDVNGSTVATVVVTTSTSSSVDNSGSIPAFGNHIATVTTANGASSIVNGNIADTRVQAAVALATGGITGSMLATSAVKLGYAQIVTNFTTTSSTAVQVTGLTATVTVPAGGRSVKITGYAPDTFATGAAQMVLSIWDGTVGSGTQIGAGFNSSGATALGTIAMAVVTPAAGSKTYNLGFKTSGGTATIDGGTGQPAFILVEAI